MATVICAGDTSAPHQAHQHHQQHPPQHKKVRGPKPRPGRYIAERPETRRAKIQARECSWRWAEDIWHGHDRDYLGVRTGSGSRKIKCCGTAKHPCGRWVPPQDVVNSIVWPPRTCPRLEGPPPTPVWICTDCRTIAIQVREPAPDETLIRGVRYERIDIEYRGEYGAVAFAELVDADLVSDDSSPMLPLLNLMSSSLSSIEEGRLPTENVEQLAQAVAVYAATGELADFARVSGEEVSAEEQRLRYRAMKKLIV